MNRRQVIGAGAVGLFGMVGAARGQEATPDASPVASPVARPGYGANGVVEAVRRDYETVRVEDDGASIIRTRVYRFADVAAADIGSSILTAGFLNYLATYVDTTQLRPAGVGEVDGEDVVGYSGDVTPLDPEEAGNVDVVGLLLSRTDEFVTLVECWAGNADPLPDALTIGQAIFGRKPNSAPESTDTFGYHVGGLWDLLPTLDDVPPGMRFVADQAFS